MRLVVKGSSSKVTMLEDISGMGKIAHDLASF
jgi:hypothetical protein